LFAFSFVFLFCDSLYFLGGSIGNFGDVVGVRETIKISRKLSILLCDAAFAFHLVIIIRCFCFPIWANRGAWGDDQTSQFVYDKHLLIF